MSQLDDLARGRREGLRWAVSWLHERAKSMRDPHARVVLQSAAWNLGNEGSVIATSQHCRPTLRGRQPGAIKKEWREVLRCMHKSGGGLHAPSVISLLAKRFGLPHDAKSVRERFRGFAANGFVEKIGSDYRVTGVAVQRFNLDEGT